MSNPIHSVMLDTAIDATGNKFSVRTMDRFLVTVRFVGAGSATMQLMASQDGGATFPIDITWGGISTDEDIIIPWNPGVDVMRAVVSATIAPCQTTVVLSHAPVGQ